MIDGLLIGVESNPVINYHVSSDNNLNAASGNSSSNSSTYGGSASVSPASSGSSSGSGYERGGGHLRIDPNLPISSQFHDYFSRSGSDHLTTTQPSSQGSSTATISGFVPLHEVSFSSHNDDNNFGKSTGESLLNHHNNSSSSRNKNKGINVYTNDGYGVGIGPNGQMVMFQSPAIPVSTGGASASGNHKAGGNRRTGGKNGKGASSSGGTSGGSLPSSDLMMTQQDANTSRHRELHKTLEKNRRAHLRQCFEELKSELPISEYGEKKSSHINIIHCAIRYINQLKKMEHEAEHEIQKLAKNKIRFQNHLAQVQNGLLMASSSDDHHHPMASHLQHQQMMMMTTPDDGKKIGQHHQHATRGRPQLNLMRNHQVNQPTGFTERKRNSLSTSSNVSMISAASSCEPPSIYSSSAPDNQSSEIPTHLMLVSNNINNRSLDMSKHHDNNNGGVIKSNSCSVIMAPVKLQQATVRIEKKPPDVQSFMHQTVIKESKEKLHDDEDDMDDDNQLVMAEEAVEVDMDHQQNHRHEDDDDVELHDAIVKTGEFPS